jgi:hypothetical protein
MHCALQSKQVEKSRKSNKSQIDAMICAKKNASEERVFSLFWARLLEKKPTSRKRDFISFPINARLFAHTRAGVGQINARRLFPTPDQYKRYRVIISSIYNK